MKTKICSRCKQEKSFDEFYNNKQSKDGKTAACKECLKMSYKNKVNSMSECEYKKVWCYQTLKSHERDGFILDISVDELFDIIKDNKTCAICGTSLKWYSNGFNCTISPTLDRINNEKIINKDNVQILCMACNSSKGDSVNCKRSRKRLPSIPLKRSFVQFPLQTTEENACDELYISINVKTGETEYICERASYSYCYGTGWCPLRFSHSYYMPKVISKLIKSRS
jgi:5-methylcytosine-specific restriction endonuclease McrA